VVTIINQIGSKSVMIAVELAEKQPSRKLSLSMSIALQSVRRTVTSHYTSPIREVNLAIKARYYG
jgi:hypothetical protein